jgi:hypothetical protein
MRGRGLLVVLVALLAITAMPASAQNASAVASEHTDFGTGDEPSPTALENMAVEGSGDSASVSLSSGGSGQLFADDFEDEPADSGTADAWETTIGSADTQEVTSSTAASGSQSYYLSTGTYVGQRPTSQPLDTPTTIPYNALINSESGVTNIRLVNGGTRLIQVGIRDGDLQYYDGSSWTLISTTPDRNEWVDLTLTPEPSTDEVTIDWQTSSASGSQTVGAEASFTDGYDAVRIFQNNGAGYFDAVSIDEQTTTSGTYIGAPHDAEQIEQGWANVTLSNAEATVTWQEDGDGDGTWSNVSSQTVTSTTNLTQDLSGTQSDRWRVRIDIDTTADSASAAIHDEGLLFEPSAPTLSDPEPTGQISDYNGDISINVSDADLGLAQGDTVVVEAANSTGATIGQQSVTNNGTVTFSYSAPPGQNDVTWTATDEYDNSATATQNFTTPATLSIFNESAPSQLVDDAGELRIRFFGDGGDVVTRNTGDGTVSLSGLPANERFVVTVSDDNEQYYYRRIIITSLYNQSEIYLLPRNASSNNVEFRLNDFTGGQFPPAETRLYIEAPIEKDFDGDGTNETRYQTIFGDTFGSSGGFPAVLATNERYRLRLTNEAGDTRVLGSYTATADVVEPLSVRGLSFNPPEGQGWATNLSVSDEPREATWKFMDPAGETSNLSVQIVDENGTVVYSDQLIGTVKNYSVYDVQLDNETQYTLNWSAQRNGQQIGQTRPVGGNDLGIKIPLDADWLGTFGMVTVVFALSLADVRKTTYVAMTAVALAGVLMALKAVNIFPPLWWLAAFIAVGAHVNTMQEPDL